MNSLSFNVMGKYPTPAFIIDLEKLEKNLIILDQLRSEANCKIVLALKAFALWHTFPLIAQYLDGCCASGLHEALLSHEKMGKSTIVYSPAYKESEFKELATFATHIDFNSVNQWKRFKDTALSQERFKEGKLHYGIRINPEHSTGNISKYDPCSKKSRLGATESSIREQDLTGITGLHFHTLCEQYTGDLESTLEALDQRFGDILNRPEITWLNMGGGHWITKPDYDREKLITLIKSVKLRYGLEQIWLEPGEAIAINSGILASTILDIIKNGSETIAILDVSPTAHMPDTLEMPYTPEVTRNNGEISSTNEQKKYKYHLGSNTCLAGDYLENYNFNTELEIGEQIFFMDMAHYTMVKTTTFNGVEHPSIILKQKNKTTIVRKFTYQDYKNRLG